MASKSFADRLVSSFLSTTGLKADPIFSDSEEEFLTPEEKLARLRQMKTDPKYTDRLSQISNRIKEIELSEAIKEDY